MSSTSWASFPRCLWLHAGTVFGGHVPAHRRSGGPLRFTVTCMLFGPPPTSLSSPQLQDSSHTITPAHTRLSTLQVQVHTSELILRAAVTLHHLAYRPLHTRFMPTLLTFLTQMLTPRRRRGGVAVGRRTNGCMRPIAPVSGESGSAESHARYPCGRCLTGFCSMDMKGFVRTLERCVNQRVCEVEVNEPGRSVLLPMLLLHTHKELAS